MPTEPVAVCTSRTEVRSALATNPPVDVDMAVDAPFDNADYCSFVFLSRVLMTRCRMKMT